MVSEAMKCGIVTAPADASAQRVARLMLDVDTGVVVLERDGAAIALVTDRDIALGVVAAAPAQASAALALASSPLVSVSPDTGLHRAAERMARYGCRRLLVSADGRPVGILTAEDIAVATGAWPLAEAV